MNPDKTLKLTSVTDDGNVIIPREQYEELMKFRMQREYELYEGANKWGRYEKIGLFLVMITSFGIGVVATMLHYDISHICT